jgi:hypothetical protein
MPTFDSLPFGILNAVDHVPEGSVSPILPPNPIISAETPPNPIFPTVPPSPIIAQLFIGVDETVDLTGISPSHDWLIV